MKRVKIRATDNSMETFEARAKTFRTKLSALKRVKRFVGCRESATVAHDLEALLEGLGTDLPDARSAVELIARFYEADSSILYRCDDSDGNIGDVFRFTARDYFVHYGSQCEDKVWLAGRIVTLYGGDDYGVRSVVMDCAGACLPERSLRGLVVTLWKKAGEEGDEYRRHHWLYGVESLAKQLGDAPLFEKACRAVRPDLSTASIIEIVQICRNSGDPEKALEWLTSIPTEDTYMAGKRDDLLLAVLRDLGDHEGMANTAWRIFRRYRSGEGLERLLEIIGEEERGRVIDGEMQAIMGSKPLVYSDAAFLVEVNRPDHAEAYLLERADQLNGNFYTTLLPLADAMVVAGKLTAACAIYRALLESILARAVSKYYPYAVRYLKKLDTLSKGIADWGKLVSHEDYKADLRRIHARKNAFWSKCKG